jgi:hypothetical protein
MATNTDGNESKTNKLAKTALICGVFGVVCTLILPIGFLMWLTAPQGYLVPLSISSLGIALSLVAVILGVVSLRRNPIPVSHRKAKQGLILGTIGPILVGFFFLVGIASGR